MNDPYDSYACVVQRTESSHAKQAIGVVGWKEDLERRKEVLEIGVWIEQAENESISIRGGLLRKYQLDARRT